MSILYALQQHQVLIISGQTGCGKSTQLPRILYDAGIYNPVESNCLKRICVTEPKKLAAIQLAERVSESLNSKIGSRVGYKVRFRTVMSPETRIVYMTEGVLIKEVFQSPTLERYSVIIVDEAHERSIQNDLILGILKCIVLKRKDLKVIVCSATLQISKFKSFFTHETHNNIVEPIVIHVSGRSYPVSIFYHKEPVPNYLDASVATAINIHETTKRNSGKILIFLTGQDEVEYVVSKLKEYVYQYSTQNDIPKLVVLPLFASLDIEATKRVFQTYGRKRVCIVSTNVAETSLTLDDVAFVIDCGFTKTRSFCQRTGIDSLVKIPISKATAIQRSGRAGRTREGLTYRLYSEAQFERMQEYPSPEIERCDLIELILTLKSLKVINIDSFPLLSKIPKENVDSSFKILSALNIVDDDTNLTNLGSIIAKFPLHPKLAKIFFCEESPDCTSELVKIVAMVMTSDIFMKKPRNTASIWSNELLTDICSAEGDLISYLNIYNQFVASGKLHSWASKRNLNYKSLLKAIDIAQYIENQLRANGIKLKTCNRVETIQKSLVHGLFLNTVYLNCADEYRTINGDKLVHLHPMSFINELGCDKPKHMVYVEILTSTKCYMKHVMAIEQNWLLDIAPHYYNFSIKLKRRVH